jgi:hypothetical protein
MKRRTRIVVVGEKEGTGTTRNSGGSGSSNDCVQNFPFAVSRKITVGNTNE